MKNQAKIKLFEDKKVRTIWDETEEQWYFSIIDVIAVLTESLDANAYWRKLKQRLKEEGSEAVTNCHVLKLEAQDGKMRLTDVAATEQLFKDLQALVGLAKFSQEYTALIVNPTLKGIANPGLKSTAYLKSESTMSLPFRATFFNAYRPRAEEVREDQAEHRAVVRQSFS